MPDYSSVAYEAATQCLLCGSGLRPSPADLQVFDHETGLGWFTIVVCNECGLGNTNPRPSPGTAHLLYAGLDTSDFDVVSGSVIDRVKDFVARRQLRTIARQLRRTPARILDYSCGNGRYAISAVAEFPHSEVLAADYSPVPPAAVRDTEVSYYQHGHLPEGDFDLIVLRHVLEHSNDPQQLMYALAERLSPGGALFIEVPNRLSGCVQIFGQHWKNHYVPRHIVHFTERTLASCVGRAGLEPTIHGVNTPMMGNYLAIRFGLDDRKTAVKLAGAALQPVQAGIEHKHHSSTSLTCLAVKPKERPDA